MNYKSVSDLNRDILSWIPDIPKDIKLIVGVPRSGLLVANLLALHLDLPLTDVEGLINKRIFASGDRSLNDLNESEIFGKYSKVLIVDDSLSSGNQLRKVKSQLSNYSFDCEILYGAVYVVPGAEHNLDLWRERLSMPRIFEWNLFHRYTISEACVDIDGVLCRDPRPDENDDGENYLKFLQDVKPNIVPSKKIGWLVTCRLEKYRPQTEAWLNKHGFEYEHLVMMDFSSKEERLKSGSHGEFKAKVYAATPAVLFIESSARQAEVIAMKSGKPVICCEGDTSLHMPGVIKYTLVKGRLNAKRYIAHFMESPVGFLGKVRRKVFKKF